MHTNVAELKYAKEFMEFIPRLKTLSNLNDEQGTKLFNMLEG